MIFDKSIKWDKVYDVVVLGFGGAGASAARFAADKGAKVLLVDKAPEGHEGGNTRYSGQNVGYTPDPVKFRTYYKQLAQGFHIDKDVEDTVINGLANMKDYFTKYLGVKPFVFGEHPEDNPLTHTADNQTTATHPEFTDSSSSELMTVHNGMFDSALWTVLRELVIDRVDNIDVWYDSPAVHIIQAPDKTVVGVQINRKGKIRNIGARNGVVLSTGGFSNSKIKIQDFIGEHHLAPVGTLYNTGDGIDLAIEAGARLWHMTTYNSAGIVGDLTLPVKEGERSIFQPADIDAKEMYTGSIFAVSDDGTRYCREDIFSIEGWFYNHGQWRTPQAPIKPYVIFDQKQYEQLAKIDHMPYQRALKNFLISADSVDELAKKIAVDPETLTATIDTFNSYAESGNDLDFHRATATLARFDATDTIYALPMVQSVAQTHGGPKRNGQAEIMDPFNKAIPHLYGAGELGGNIVRIYQGGENLADCLIFGKVAGENAAEEKADKYGVFSSAPDVTSGASVKEDADLLSDMKKKCRVKLDKNQYLGTSSAGMGNEIVVRVTVDDDQNIKNIEVLQESESEDYGKRAIKALPKIMIEKNTYDVDAVSGASSSSRAMREAVKMALDSAKEKK
ncbi:FAD-dependent oxidoreductase [Lactobacillus xylocopicola]|uniref:Urocanate reductase n=1 Tax=Lactobacillus xylocopicola TaxID=2976676 RepID=A0ABN6SHZ9_9LACO|nr:FAD-dependent oxidoreductase [Lactobacillus xylocopicola]BDR59921.1 fumarate reductase [Lactobacillus xylocopicola]